MFENNCIICFESINDPVCVHCYIKQAGIWLEDKEVNPDVKSFILSKIKNLLIIEQVSEAECIFCKNDSVNVCFFCFSRMTLQILGELNFSEGLMDDFSEAFKYNSSDYDTHVARTEGYSKTFDNNSNEK